jgi:hypothetical protein
VCAFVPTLAKDALALLIQINALSDLGDLIVDDERDFDRDFDRAWRDGSVWPCGFFIRD